MGNALAKDAYGRPPDLLGMLGYHYMKIIGIRKQKKNEEYAPLD